MEKSGKNLSLFADDMIVYTENPIDSTKKNPTQTNKWFWQNSRIQSQYSEIKEILYTNNEISGTEIREKIPFAIATRKIKYLGINLTKEVKDLYSENYTTMKKLRKTQINGSIYCVHGLEELTSSKCPHYPKQFIDSTNPH